MCASMQLIGFVSNLFGHTGQFFLKPSPYACRGRTVLQFPTNSYHLFTVELTIKALLAGYLPLIDLTEYARLLIPNKGKPELSMVATARVLWLCACIRYWPYRGAGTCASVQLIGNVKIKPSHITSPLD